MGLGPESSYFSPVRPKGAVVVAAALIALRSGSDLSAATLEIAGVTIMVTFARSTSFPAYSGREG